MKYFCHLLVDYKTICSFKSYILGFSIHKNKVHRNARKFADDS